MGLENMERLEGWRFDGKVKLKIELFEEGKFVFQQMHWLTFLNTISRVAFVYYNSESSDHRRASYEKVASCTYHSNFSCLSSVSLSLLACLDQASVWSAEPLLATTSQGLSTVLRQQNPRASMDCLLCTCSCILIVLGYWQGQSSLWSYSLFHLALLFEFFVFFSCPKQGYHW